MIQRDKGNNKTHNSLFDSKMSLLTWMHSIDDEESLFFAVSDSFWRPVTLKVIAFDVSIIASAIDPLQRSNLSLITDRFP